MKKNKILKNTLIMVLSYFYFVSCGVQNGYTETDGIYYDATSDKIEQRIAWQDLDYNHSESIIGQSQKNNTQQNNRFSTTQWGEQKISSSDWGVYTGTQNNYYSNYSYLGFPYYNFYSPYYLGYYNSYFGSYYPGGVLGTYFNNPWTYGYNFNPYYNGFYPNYYPSFYSFGYGYVPFYLDYYSSPATNYRKSEPDRIYRDSSYYQKTYDDNNYSYPNNDGFNNTSNWGNSNQIQGVNFNSNSNFNSSDWGNSGSFYDR